MSFSTRHLIFCKYCIEGKLTSLHLPPIVKTFSVIHYRFLEGVLNICCMWKLQIVITFRFSDTKRSDAKEKQKEGERGGKNRPKTFTPRRMLR